MEGSAVDDGSAETTMVTGGELTLMIEYPIFVTVVGLGEGDRVISTVCVVGGRVMLSVSMTVVVAGAGV